MPCECGSLPNEKAGSGIRDPGSGIRDPGSAVRGSQFAVRSSRFAIRVEAGRWKLELEAGSWKLETDIERTLSMKVGLYSITYLGAWYRGRALTLEELIDRAREYGYEGVEFDGKRPHASPLDMPRRRCQEVQMKARD